MKKNGKEGGGGGVTQGFPMLLFCFYSPQSLCFPSPSSAQAAKKVLPRLIKRFDREFRNEAC